MPPTTGPDDVPLRLLCVATREPRWTAFSVHMESALGSGLRLQWVASVPEALTLLRDSCPDALLIAAECLGDAAAADAVQTLDSTAAVVVLLPVPNDRLLAELAHRDCDVCISPRLWDSPALPAVVLQAVRRRQCRLELQRHAATHLRRLSREQAEAESLLRMQHDLLRTMRSVPAANQPLVDGGERYDELLKASILSGPKRLGRALDDFVRELVCDHRRPADVLAWHIERVEALLAGMGGRTSQHLLSRADLLALEVLVRMGEQYRAAATAAHPAA